MVFSQFVKHLDILREHLDERGISYQYLDGSTPSAKRQEAIDGFQNGTGDLFPISLKAGGAGINLTAADYVIHMDPWWNPAVEDQATDRAHRIGQNKPVTVYRLVTKDTIESKILKLHEHKRDLADQLLTGSDISAKLTADDLLDLLGGKKKNGHKMSCGCPICVNMKHSKHGGSSCAIKTGGKKRKGKGNGHKSNCGCPICKNMRKTRSGDDSGSFVYDNLIIPDSAYVNFTLLNKGVKPKELTITPQILNGNRKTNKPYRPEPYCTTGTQNTAEIATGFDLPEFPPESITLDETVIEKKLLC